MAERLTPLDLEVGCSRLVHHVVSLDTELYSTLSLFTQVYKWVPATYRWGATLRWTCISSRKEWQYSKAYFSLRKLKISSGCVRLYLYVCYAQGALAQYLRAIFGQKENFPVYLSRKNAIIIPSKHGTTIYFFFLLQSFSRKT